MKDGGFWAREAPASITVTDADGTILWMNDGSIETFAADGGADLIGKSVFDCHPEPSLTKTRDLYRDRRGNHYTIRKDGRTKIVHQMPWYMEGAFAGFVEIVIPIPDTLPHADRDVGSGVD